MPTKLIGTEPYQLPRNADLGTLAFQDASSVRIDGGYVATKDTLTSGLHQDTEVSDVRPTLLLDFANSKALDPRITFSRTSTGTYYDGKTVAKAEENLLTWSQAFDNVAWTKSGATTIANSTTAPDGTLTADTFVESSGGTFHYVFAPYLTYIPSGSSIAASCYIKANGRSLVQINTGNAQSVTFDLTSGAVGAQNNATGAITSAGSGWYRCVITAVTAGSGTSFQIYTGTGSSTFDYTGDGTSGIFIWGAQLEQRASATAYTPTTTQPVTNYIPALQTAASGVPRFEHNPLTGESLGLEIEEQRTNLLTYSEQFDNAVWSKINTTITVNTVVAPDGTLTGDKLASSTASIVSHQDYQIGITITNAAAYTWSVYMKQGEYAWGIVNAYSGTDSRTYFNLATGTVGTVAAGNTATITPVGNGWYRCSVTRTSAAATGGLSIEITNADNVPSFAANVGSGIYIWGAQLEAGAFPTSYIPTGASQITRAADSAAITGTNFSGWYNQSEGTVYAESTTSQSAAGYVLTFGDGTSNNRIDTTNGSGLGAFQVTTSGTVVVDTNTRAITGKIAGTFKANDFASSINGTAAVTDTSGAVPMVTRADFGRRADTSAFTLNGNIKKIAYYPKRLSNAELQEITLP